ncbi:MAG TPA: DUF2520 domain-containing protein [Pyrinomonadaceae bacterium]|nr:DUF2520 domain-containing protein [Pyrinomonadaceae bacterium]
MRSVSILGIGRAGGALALALSRAGVPIDRLIYRADPPAADGLDRQRLVLFDSIDAIESDVLLIATADQDIRSTADSLAKFAKLPSVVLHLSGSLSSDELSILREKNAAVGSMHPLVSISDAELGSERFLGSYFCVEGDSNAVASALRIVELLGGQHFSIETSLKALYHASAVMASGNVVALFDAAIEMLSKCGLDREQAHRILFPLLQSTVANLAERSTEQALTGPFVRGDSAALERHLAAFEGTIDDSIRSIYLDLAERSVKLAGGEHTAELLTAISVAKRKTGC